MKRHYIGNYFLTIIIYLAVKLQFNWIKMIIGHENKKQIY